MVEEFKSLPPAGLSTTHGALQHILAQPEVSTVIPGTKSLTQLRDNVATIEAELPEQTVEAIRLLGRAQAVLSW